MYRVLPIYLLISFSKEEDHFWPLNLPEFGPLLFLTDQHFISFLVKLSSILRVIEISIAKQINFQQIIFFGKKFRRDRNNAAHSHAKKIISAHQREEFHHTRKGTLQQHRSSRCACTMAVGSCARMLHGGHCRPSPGRPPPAPPQPSPGGRRRRTPDSSFATVHTSSGLCSLVGQLQRSPFTWNLKVRACEGNRIATGIPEEGSATHRIRSDMRHRHLCWALHRRGRPSRFRCCWV